jgi:hypothetical protein
MSKIAIFECRSYSKIPQKTGGDKATINATPPLTNVQKTS